MMYQKVKEAVVAKTKGFQAIFVIPPFSESMAGVIVLFVFLNSIATSMWMHEAWTPFIYQLFNKSNKYVGFMAAANGVSELVCALISGHVADRVWGPSRTLSFAVRFGLVNLCVVLTAVWVEKAWLLVIAQCFEGCYMGFSFTCVESVFAQCLRNGERDRLYSVKYSCESAGPIAGLVLSILLYAYLGNDWSVGILRGIMTFGVMVHIVSMILFLYLFVPLPSHLDRSGDAVVISDDTPTQKLGDYLAEEHRISDGVEVEEEVLSPAYVVSRRCTELFNRARTSLLAAYAMYPPVTSRYEPSVCTAQDGDNGSLTRGGRTYEPRDALFSATENDADRVSVRSTIEREETTDFTSPPAVDVDNVPAGMKVVYVDPEYDESSSCRRQAMDCIPLRSYPFIVAACDIVTVVGSGMTTQYFSLFMLDVYDVSPVTLAFLKLGNAFIIAFMAILTGYFGQRFGRVRSIIPPKLVGSFILLWMALTKNTKYGPKSLMCIAFMLRNAFMNCSAGLSRALIMDLVPEKNHGRWNAIESVQSAGWSGTALIGGFLADKWGYGSAFILTFGFHISATSAMLPLTIRNDARLPYPIYVKTEEAAAAAAEGTDEKYNPSTPDDAPTEVVSLTAENLRKITSCVSVTQIADLHSLSPSAESNQQ